MSLAAAAFVVALACGLVLRDVRRHDFRPIPAPPAPAPPAPAPPAPAPPAPAPPAPAVGAEPAATAVTSATLPVEPPSESMLGRFGAVETDLRPRLLQRVAAAATLFLLTAATAAALAFGIYRAVRSFG